jgi:hypothetical protein
MFVLCLDLTVLSYILMLNIMLYSIWCSATGLAVRHKLSQIQTELLSLGIRRYEEDSRAYAADVGGAPAPKVTPAKTAIVSTATASASASLCPSYASALKCGVYINMPPPAVTTKGAGAGAGTSTGSSLGGHHRPTNVTSAHTAPAPAVRATVIAKAAAGLAATAATAAELAAAAQEKYTHGAPPTMPVVLTFRELLLNTVPYHRSIAQLRLQHPQLAAERTQFLHNGAQENLPVAPQTSLESAPIYTELVDWLIGTVYSREQQSIQSARSFARQPASALSLDTTLPMDEVIEEFEEGK